MREAELLGGICGEESLSEFGGQCSEAGFVGGGGFEVLLEFAGDPGALVEAKHAE